MARAIIGLVLLAGLGCTAGTTTPTTSAPRTPADLIVGKWRLVDSDRPFNTPVRDLTLEFESDGKMRDVSDFGTADQQIRKGNYHISDDKLVRTWINNSTGKFGKSHTVQITKLTDTELALRVDDATRESKFERIRHK